MKIYKNYTILNLILGILAIFMFYFTNISSIKLIVGLLYLIITGYHLGNIFFAKQEVLEKIVLGTLSFSFIIIIASSIFFYFYSLNDLFFIFITLTIPILLFLLSNKNLNAPRCQAPYRVPDTCTTSAVRFNLPYLALNAIYIFLTATLFYILISHSTTSPIRTPWEVLPKYFFATFFVNTLALISILLKKDCAQKINYKLIFISIYLFLIFTIAYFVYKIGYGFDPFIHRATLKIILQTGTITPKPFYYIGQYGLIIYLVKLFGLSINFLEKILVPLMSAIMLPVTLFLLLSREQKNKKTRKQENIKTIKQGDNLLSENVKEVEYSSETLQPHVNIEAEDPRVIWQNHFSFNTTYNWLILLSFFLLPLNFLIVTTPQNLANLLFVVLIILTLNYSFIHNHIINKHSILLILNGLAILFIHPLSGIPALLFLILYFLWQKYSEGGKKIFSKLFCIISCIGLISLPTIWFINSKISPQASVTINTEILDIFTKYLSNLKLLALGNYGQFKIVLNIIYFFYFNLPIILALVFIYSFKIIYKNQNIKQYIPCLAAFIIFFLNYLILKIFINFNFLINYEQENYTNRVLQISYFFLLPFFIFFLEELWQKIKLKKFWIKNFAIIVFAAGLCASLYLTYPRHDDFTASHGYNTSKYDIEAVNYIEKTAKEDFVVLANQQVSAAALKEFGFKKYYNNKEETIFYYPIPTGGSLYEYYLDMVNKKPTKEIMENAMQLAGVKNSYFVVNKYWWESQKIIDLTKLFADEYKIIGNGEVYVFKYTAPNKK